MAEIAKRGREGWEQPCWVEAAVAAQSQVFLCPPSPNTAGSGPAETSRSQERDRNRSSVGRGWETQGLDSETRSAGKEAQHSLSHECLRVTHGQRC